MIDLRHALDRADGQSADGPQHGILGIEDAARQELPARLLGQRRSATLAAGSRRQSSQPGLIR